MPDDHKEVRVKRRNTLLVVDPEEDEQEYDHEVEECDKIEDDKKDSNAQLKLQREFEKLLDDTAYSAVKFVMKCQDDKQIENALDQDTIDDI